MELMLIALLILGNLVPVNVGAGSQTSAFITNIKGTVRVSSRGKREAKVSESEPVCLYEHDTVKVGDDGEALLWQSYSKILLLAPKTSRVITRLPPSSGPDILSPSEYLKCETDILDSIRDTRRPSPRKQGSGDEPYFVALSPRFSLVLGPRPVFEWSSVKNAVGYDFNLYDDEQAPIWQKHTNESRLTYPDQNDDKKARILKPGKYRWEVFAITDQRTKKYDASEFTIVTAEEAGAIQTALSRAKGLTQKSGVTNLIYVAMCIEHQQYPEAEKALRAAVTNNPDNQIFKALLMLDYERMKRWDEREDLRIAFKDSDLNQVGEKFRIGELLRDKK